MPTISQRPPDRATREEEITEFFIQAVNTASKCSE